MNLRMTQIAPIPSLPINERELMLVLRHKGEDEIAVFSVKSWDRRNRADLIESATPCHDAQEVGSSRGMNPLHLTVLTAKSEDYTAAPQHLQNTFDL